MVQWGQYTVVAVDLSLLASVEMVDSAADSCLQCRVHPSAWLDHVCPLDSTLLQMGLQREKGLVYVHDVVEGSRQ